MAGKGWYGRRKSAPPNLIPGPPGPDLVDRQFTVPAPNVLVVADFTYVRLSTGAFVYTAFAIDAFAGRIVGWQCSGSKHTVFVESAIRQPRACRRMDGKPLTGSTIHHSDAGSQYTSVRFSETLMLAGPTPSIGTVGTPTTTPWPRRRSGSTRPKQCARTHPSGRAHWTGWPTWNCSPRTGSIGTTPAG